MQSDWVIHKFGGTSLGDATRMKTVVQLMAEAAQLSKIGIVVSAVGTSPLFPDLKVTDSLLSIAQIAMKGKKNSSSVTDVCERLCERHSSIMDELELQQEVKDQIIDHIKSDLQDLVHIAHTISITRSSPHS